MAIQGQVPVESSSYVFEGAGGMRDQLEQTILKKLEAAHYPLSATVKNVKGGRGLMGAIAGSKEECVVIDVTDKYTLNIACTTVGTYLYVGVYLMMTSSLLNGANIGGIASSWAASVGDVFQLQRLRSYYGTALAITETAFCALNLKQANSGYKRESNN